MSSANLPKKRAAQQAEKSCYGRQVSSLLIAVLVAVGVFLYLALFARGGPTETIAITGISPEAAGVAKLTLPELGSVVNRIFDELGFVTLAKNSWPQRCDLTVLDPTPVTGQKVYIRCLLTPQAGAVQSAEVQAALDMARNDNLHKAMVVTPGTFSDEARLVSQGASLELIDGDQLAQLIRKHLPDVANRLGLPR
jgi:Restriction endonuclease